MKPEDFIYYGKVHQWDQYHDYEFASADGCRMVTITYDDDLDCWYSSYCESEDSLSDFGETVELDDDVTQEFVDAIPKDELPHNSPREDDNVKHLSSFSSDWEVMEVLLEAYIQAVQAATEDEEYTETVYDYNGGRIISSDDVRTVIAQMKTAESLVI